MSFADVNNAGLRQYRQARERDRNRAIFHKIESALISANPALQGNPVLLRNLVKRELTLQGFSPRKIMGNF